MFVYVSLPDSLQLSTVLGRFYRGGGTPVTHNLFIF